MSRVRKIAAHILLFLVVSTSYILAGLKDGFTLEALDFGTSPWWNVGLIAFLLSPYLFACQWADEKGMWGDRGKSPLVPIVKGG